MVMYKHPLPPQHELREEFDYDPLTGQLTRIKQHNGAKRYLGPIRVHNGRQACVCTHGKGFVAARIIWRWMTGDDPGELEVDHKDSDPKNDRWCNLRLASGSQNTSYRRKKLGISGHVGVVAYGNRWVARVNTKTHGRVSKGPFDTIEEAARARVELEKTYLGEFAPSLGQGPYASSP